MNWVERFLAVLQRREVHEAVGTVSEAANEAMAALLQRRETRVALVTILEAFADEYGMKWSETWAREFIDIDAQ